MILFGLGLAFSIFLAYMAYVNPGEKNVIGMWAIAVLFGILSVIGLWIECKHSERKQKE